MKIIADQCRYAQWVAQRHNYGFEILDGGEGYLFRISRGDKSFFAGAGPLSSYPLNSSFAATAARDKVFANRLLDLAGVPNLGGRAFFLTAESRQLRGPGYEVEDARLYFSELGEKAFCKPLAGSRGTFAEPVRGSDAFDDYISRCAQKHPAIVVQPLFAGEETRVFVFDATPIFCIEKGAVNGKPRHCATDFDGRRGGAARGRSWLCAGGEIRIAPILEISGGREGQKRSENAQNCVFGGVWGPQTVKNRKNGPKTAGY